MVLWKRIWQWLDDRIAIRSLVKPAKHLVPRSSGWWYVFGSATLTAFILQVFTGIALATVYVPSPAHAFDTLQFLTHQAWIGHFIRGLHYFGASAMVLFIGVHMIRVFLMGSYKFPREMNWLSGLLLFGSTLIIAFTGQLLRWDQNAVWTAIVTAEQAGRVPLIGKSLAHLILGGDVLGAQTLTRFFAMHALIFPAVLAAVLGLHLFLVLHHGISEPPKPGVGVDRKTYRDEYQQVLRREGVPFWPDAAWRDIAFSLLLIAGIVILAIWLGPPELTKPPNPTIIQAEPRPDWYFLWYFALLALLPHASENYFMFLAPACAAIVLILLPFVFNQGERNARRRPWAAGFIVILVLMVGTLWVQGKKSPWSPNFNARPLPESVVGTQSGPVAAGAELFYGKGCIYCHTIEGRGGQRGPDLTTVADRIGADQMTIRIMTGGHNMPAFGGNMESSQLSDLVAFLKTRTER